jgi:predicted DNA-binding antitoxin AbrB/MazE fold protein
MSHFKAIYRNGRLQPVAPVDLAEGTEVSCHVFESPSLAPIDREKLTPAERQKLIEENLESTFEGDFPRMDRASHYEERENRILRRLSKPKEGT